MSTGASDDASHHGGHDIDTVEDQSTNGGTDASATTSLIRPSASMKELVTQTLSTVDLRRANTALVWFIAAVLIVSMALIAADIAQRDSHIRRVATHLWQRLGPEGNAAAADATLLQYVPQTPSAYSPLQATDVHFLLVFGDSSANGDGVANRDQEAWYMSLRNRYMPQATVVRLAQSFARIADLSRQVDRLAALYPSGLSGNVIVTVQVGAEDVLDAVLNSGTTQRFDVDAWSARLERFASTLLANTTVFPRGGIVAQTRVYVLDYADASSTLGYIASVEMQCRVPLDSLLNAPSTPQSGSALVRAFDVFSTALALRARDSYSAVPVRFALSRRGGFGRRVTQRANATVAASTNSSSASADVAFADCFFLNTLGQRYVADLLAAHIEQRTYTVY